MIKTSKNLVGATGEYYVCAELGKRGIIALIAPKNNPLFDIIAVSPDASRTVTIQVKTMSLENKMGWRLSKSICARKNNPLMYTVLVNLNGSPVDYYIYEYDTLSERVEKFYTSYLNTPKKDGGKRKDIDFRWYDFTHFSEDDLKRKNNWQLLGF